jgi:hypothetical protein
MVYAICSIILTVGSAIVKRAPERWRLSFCGRCLLVPAHFICLFLERKLLNIVVCEPSCAIVVLCTVVEVIFAMIPVFIQTRGSEVWKRADAQWLISIDTLLCSVFAVGLTTRKYASIIGLHLTFVCLFGKFNAARCGAACI